MDSLAKTMNVNPGKLYNKGVLIPPLEMVDNILNVTSVENTSIINESVKTHF